MVRCTQFINIIERDNIAENVTAIGNHVITELRSIAKETDAFTSVRGKGSLIAFTLSSPEQRAVMLQTMMDLGLIALPCGTQSVRFRLPLIMTMQDANELLTITHSVVTAMTTTA